jgi:hypothetical protein
MNVLIRRLAISFLNCVFGTNEQSTMYWQQTIKKKLREQFPRSLSVEEAEDTYDLKASLDGCCLLKVFETFTKLMGMRFSSYSRYINSIQVHILKLFIH